MDRVAVFVDAGYLLAQGSVVLAGSKRPRNAVILDAAAAIAELTDLARRAADNAPLLRIYWYDGILGKRPTIEHDALAGSPNVKMRLGAVNSAGEQKGVDSMIVIDMIDLGRNRAISDALLLSGDEDVRVGVQVAQTFGVRVHLLGIEPSRGSQSNNLICEADTTYEWGGDVITRIMSLRPAEPVIAPSPVIIEESPDSADTISRTSAAYADEIKPTEASTLLEHWKRRKSIPPDYDGRLLARNRAALGGRDLEPPEKRSARRAFITGLAKKLDGRSAGAPASASAT